MLYEGACSTVSSSFDTSMGLTEEDKLMLTHVNKADSYFLNVRMDFDFHNVTICHFVFCVVF